MIAHIVKCQHCGTKNKIPVLKQHLQAKCGRCGQTLSLPRAIKPVEISDSEFQGLIATASLPVLVEFFSPSCGPCQMLAPVLDRVAPRYADRLIIAKLEVGRNPLTPSRFQITGVPTLLLFENGRLVDKLTGAVSEKTLSQRLDALSARGTLHQEA